MPKRSKNPLTFFLFLFLFVFFFQFVVCPSKFSSWSPDFPPFFSLFSPFLSSSFFQSPSFFSHPRFSPFRHPSPKSFQFPFPSFFSPLFFFTKQPPSLKKENWEHNRKAHQRREERKRSGKETKGGAGDQRS